jgi:hypothetical protein
LERRTLLSQAISGVLKDTTGVSGQLLQLAQSAPPVDGGAAVSGPAQFMFDDQGRVAVDITADDVNALAGPLANRGFVQTASLPADHLVEGYLPLSAIQNINDLSGQGLLGVMPVYKPITATGSVNSQGDNILEAQRTRAATGDTGAGVTVGVLSDSYNNQGGAAAGVASGDLPNNVNVLQDLSSGGTDEGRAMLEIVHDLAPGANLAFATADTGEAGFAANIGNLAKPVAQGGAGASVITDDITYFDEPYFQDGIVAQAIDNAATTYGAVDFVAAGNIDTQSYESTNVNFMTDTLPGIYSTPQSYYNFNPGGAATDKQSFSLTNGQAVILGLQWNNPYYTASGVTSDLDIFILNHNTGQVVAASANDNFANQKPNEIVSFQNTTGATATFDVVIQRYAGPTPTRLKWVNFGANEFGDVSFQFATNSDTVNPHSASANAMSVGAVPFFDQRNPEGFTSSGPATILFTANGTPQAPQVRAKPDITAVDGVDTSFFGSDFDGNGKPNFFGTSAAAPHAAAVAALIRAQHPAFTPAQVYTAMRNSADPNIGTGNVNLIGAGLVDAYRATVGNPAPATLNVSDGFESGALGQDWEVYTSIAGRVNVVNGLSPSSGSFQLVEDANLVAPAGNAYNQPNLDEAILHVNLAGATNVSLSFDKKSFFDGVAIESTQTMPATFTGHNNSDGVAISVDGTHWFLVQQLIAATNSSYSTFTINLSNLAATDGITLGADTRIKFQHYDPFSSGAPDVGFGFDNISVSGTVINSGSIAGQLFQDNNGNGVFDSGEPTLNGVTVFLDINNNGVLDGGETSVVTSGSGNYNFGSLANGTYHLRQVLPAGYIQSSTPSDPIVSGGAIVSNIGDFPVTFPIAPATGSGNDNYALSLDATGTIEQINDGSTTYTIAKSALASTMLTFNGNAGDDTLTVNLANGSPVGAAGVTFNGGTQTNGDTLAIVGGTGSDMANFNGATINVGNIITDSGVETFSFNGNGGGDLVSVNSGTVLFPATQVFNGFSVQNGATAQLTPGGNKVMVFNTNSFSIGSGSTIDLTDNDAIFKNEPLSTIQTFVGNGFNGGVWNGTTSITSSTAASMAANSANTHKTALGYALGSSTTLGPSFDGQTVNPTDVVIRYTDFGDANLDGNTNTLDFMRLGANFGGSGKTWSQADFTFNGTVNALDFNQIATNFGQVLPGPATASLFSTAQVPATTGADEPLVGGNKVSLWDSDLFAKDRNADALLETTA